MTTLQYKNNSLERWQKLGAFFFNQIVLNYAIDSARVGVKVSESDTVIAFLSLKKTAG